MGVRQVNDVCALNSIRDAAAFIASEAGTVRLVILEWRIA
jgi:hypothetical protein